MKEQILLFISRILPEYTNISASSILMRIVDVFSSVLNIFSSEFTRSEEIIAESARSQNVGNEAYYKRVALAYQEGYELVEIDTTTHEYGYETIDPDAQIIKQVSLQFLNNTASVIISVATTDSSGKLIPLTSDQLSAFTGYMAYFTFVQIPVVCRSYDADILNARIEISYMKEFNLSDIQNNVETAMNTFLVDQTYTGGLFFLNDLARYLRENVTGIRNVYIFGASLTNYNGVVTSFDNSIIPTAGYITYSDTLIENIEYEAISAD